MEAGAVGADPLEPVLTGGPTTAPQIDRGDVPLGVRVGTGAQGDVFVVDDETVAKLFHRLSRRDGVALSRLVAFRAGLPDHERRALDEHAVWPATLIDDGDRVVGYLMREIPPPFWQRIETMDGAELIPREAQHLVVDGDLGTRNLGETATVAERLALARSLAVGLALLHRHDLVFGDLSYRNEVYALRPSPSVLLIDCDAVRVRGEGTGAPQLHSPGWKPPEGGAPSLASDRYKLGLFVLRCVTPGVNAQNRDPEAARHALDRPARRLLHASLSASPGERPPADAWVAELDRLLELAGGVAPRTETPPDPAPPPRVERGDRRVDGLSPARTAGGGRRRHPVAGRSRRRPTTSASAPATAPLRKVPVKVHRPLPHRVHPTSVRSTRPATAWHAAPVAAAPSPSPASVLVWTRTRRRIALVVAVLAVVGVLFTVAFELRQGA